MPSIDRYFKKIKNERIALSGGNDLNTPIINFFLGQPEASELQMNLRIRFEALSKSPLNQVAHAPYGGWSSKVLPER